MAKPKANPMQPLDGKYIHSIKEQKTACRANGHPLMFLNVSKSKVGAECWRCLCGEREEARRTAGALREMTDHGLAAMGGEI